VGVPIGALIKYAHEDELALGLSMREVLDRVRALRSREAFTIGFKLPFVVSVKPIELDADGLASDETASERISRELRNAMNTRDMAKIRRLMAERNQTSDDNDAAAEELEKLGDMIKESATSPSWSDEEMTAKPQTKTLRECESLFSIFEQSGVIDNDFVPFAMTELFGVVLTSGHFTSLVASVKPASDSELTPTEFAALALAYEESLPTTLPEPAEGVVFVSFSSAASLGMSMDLGTQLNLPIVLRVADGGPVSEANIPTGSHIVYLHGDRVEPEEGVLQLASNKVCVTRAKEKEVV
jgi:hypothetical protein